MIKKNVLLTALAIAGFAVTSLAQTVPNYVPSNGLVGWWPFNGNAVDESSNTNDGTVNGAALTADRFGNANAAYSFDGINDFIDLTSISFNITSNSNRTISCWAFFNNTFSDYRLISTGTPSNSNSFNLVVHSGGYLGCMGFIQDFYPTNGQLLNNNNWYNLVLVFENNIIKIYINGLLDNSSGTVLLNTLGNINFFGKSNDSQYPSYLNGKLDDIGIWNRALSPSEITSLYNGNLCFQTITVTDTLLINTNITGFNPVTYQNTIKIWPNPTNDHITIDNGNLANLTGHQIKISNALGQQVFQSAITQQQFYVDMSTWGGNGIYFVNLINAQGVTIETRKIVLQ